jgi:hypothetical protein
MIKYAIAGLITTAFLLGSCEPAATFDKPQPDHINPLASFPKRIQGKYISADQVSIVTISDELLTRTYDFDEKEHKDSIGSTYKLIGDTLIDQTEGTKEKVLLKGDTVIMHIHLIDTLFSISADHVLKKFKGYYFLNSRYSDHAWEVKKLSFRNSLLTVGNVSDEEDIDKLNEITEASSDTLPRHYALSRKQFKKFIRQEGFSEQETFTRMVE